MCLLARDVLGAAPPQRLQAASAASRAQLAAMLPWLAGDGLGLGDAAATELPAELASGEGPEELAAVLRKLTGEADTAPGAVELCRRAESLSWAKYGMCRNPGPLWALAIRVRRAWPAACFCSKSCAALNQGAQ